MKPEIHDLLKQAVGGGVLAIIFIIGLMLALSWASRYKEDSETKEKPEENSPEQ